MDESQSNYKWKKPDKGKKRIYNVWISNNIYIYICKILGNENETRII